MPRAYVAKAASVTVPASPPGWGDWPWPGPYPPGYTPVYSITNTGPSYLAVADPASAITTEIFDQATYGTKEPSAAITWSATINGNTVQLKFSGDPSFADTVSSAWENLSDEFWSGSKTLVFDVDSGDVGETITVTASTSMDDSTVSNTLDMEVVANNVWEMLFECSMPTDVLPQPDPPTEYNYGCRMYGHKSTGQWATPWGWVQALQYSNWLGVQYWGYDDGASPFSPMTDFGIGTPSTDGHAWIYEVTSVGYIYMRSFQIQSGITYSFDHKHETTNVPSGSVQFDYTLTVYKNGVQQDQKTKSVTRTSGQGADSITTWCTIDGDTRAITVVNP